MSASRERTLVLGIGNPLMGDDGAGIQAVRMLSESHLPQTVTVLEAGTPGWGLAEWIKGWPSVIIVDAAQIGQKPGAWKRFDAGAVSLIAQQACLSLHEPDLADGLALAQAMDLLPERLSIYGIEPQSTAPGMTLSPAVRENLPGLVDRILDELRTGR